MTLSDTPIQKIHHYHPSEVAKVIGVTTTCLRQWEKEFNLSIKRNVNGDRRYLEQDLSDLLLISRLRQWFQSDKAVALWKKGVARDVIERLEGKNKGGRPRGRLCNIESPSNPTPQVKIKRVIMLLERLRNGGVTVEQLSRELEISERSSYRYLQTVEEAGLPLEKGFDDKYFIQS